MAAPTAWPIQFASGAKPRKKYEKNKCLAWTFNIKWKEGQDWLVFDISSCLTVFR
jgi:hypothetical protein